MLSPNLRVSSAKSQKEVEEFEDSLNRGAKTFFQQYFTKALPEQQPQFTLMPFMQDPINHNHAQIQLSVSAAQIQNQRPCTSTSSNVLNNKSQQQSQQNNAHVLNKNDESLSENMQSMQDYHPNDFGHVVRIGADGLSDLEKYRYLTNFYTPPSPPHHEWPAEVRQVKGKTVVRRLNPSILSRHDCTTMAYSPMYGGLFCRYCAVFPPSKPQISKSAFIKKPFVRFSHMFGNGGAVKKHINRKYHLESAARAEIFLSQMKESNCGGNNNNGGGGGGSVVSSTQLLIATCDSSILNGGKF